MQKRFRLAFSAAELNIWVIIIPAGATWLLQPLDVCCFGSFKRHLKDEYCRARSAKGKVTAPEWLVLVIQAAVWLGSRSWTLTFQLTGITGHGQQRLRKQSEAQLKIAHSLPECTTKSVVRFVFCVLC